jgi:hypothetical protein
MAYWSPTQIWTLSFKKLRCDALINVPPFRSRGRILGRNPDKVLQSFSMLFTVISTALPWDFYFFTLKHPLTVSTVHCKGEWRKAWEKTIPPSLWYKKSINPYRDLKSENSQDYRNSMFINSASVWNVSERIFTKPDSHNTLIPTQNTCTVPKLDQVPILEASSDHSNGGAFC